MISLLTQFCCYGRQCATLIRYLHHRQCWKTLIAAEGAYRTTVGAVTIGITVSKPNAFLAQAVDISTGSFYSTERLYQCSTEAFHQNDKDIGSLGAKQLYRTFIARRIKSLKQRCTFFFAKVIELVAVILGLAGRSHQTESRIHSRVIEEFIITEVYLPYVGCRLRNASSDNYKQRSAYEYHRSCSGYLLLYCRQNRWSDTIKSPRTGSRKQQNNQGTHYQEPSRYAGSSILWRIKIKENRCVELEFPERIKAHIYNEHNRDHKRYKSVICHEQLT